jgi:hypothetical protein
MLTREEFANLVGATARQVELWHDAGLVDPEGLGATAE